MRNLATFLTSMTILAGCVAAGPDPTWVAELQKAGHDRNAVFMGGAGDISGIPTREEAYALASNNKGKKGNYVGYIWSVRVSGNRAAIEVIPNFSGEQARKCTGNLGCLEQRRALFSSSVTCHVNDWNKLNAQTGGIILKSAQTKWENSDNWHHVALQGTISHAEEKVVKFKALGVSGGSFGLGGGYFMRGVFYRTIHANNCRILTFKSKALAS